MNENERESALKVVHYLNRGLDEMRPDLRRHLQAARADALARRREPQPVPGLAWAGHAGAFFRRGRFTLVHYIAVAALLATSATGVTYWQTINNSDEDTEVDVSLLTGELPINAYLDGGFEAWLKRSSK